MAAASLSCLLLLNRRNPTRHAGRPSTALCTGLESLTGANGVPKKQTALGHLTTNWLATNIAAPATAAEGLCAAFKRIVMHASRIRDTCYMFVHTPMLTVLVSARTHGFFFYSINCRDYVIDLHSRMFVCRIAVCTYSVPFPMALLDVDEVGVETDFEAPQSTGLRPRCRPA